MARGRVQTCKTGLYLTSCDFSWETLSVRNISGVTVRMGPLHFSGSISSLRENFQLSKTKHVTFMFYLLREGEKKVLFPHYTTLCYYSRQ